MTAAQQLGATVVAGSWGSIPTALQQLPPGASLCGTAYTGDAATDVGYTYVLSDIEGSAITSFYGPLVAKISGCSAVSEVATTGSYSFTCPCSTPPCGVNSATGIINPVPDYQILALGYTD